MDTTEILERLCYYDINNPNHCINLDDLTPEELTIPQIKGKDYANPECKCDNCFYGRTKLAQALLDLTLTCSLETSNVTRVEVIQHSEPFNGRAYSNYQAKDVEVQIQDEGRTLKLFLK